MKRLANKKNVLIMILVLILVLGLCGCNNSANEDGDAEAIDYPTRDIEIYVGHGAGGGTDNFVRAIASELKDILGVNVVVINKPGAAGVVAKQEAATLPADGYTLMAIPNLAVTTAAGTNPLGLEAIRPIARIQCDTYAIQVKTGAFDNIEEFLEYAKANPGKLRIGGVASLSMDDLIAHAFMKEAGIELTYVPMESAGQMHAAVLGGHIEVMIEELGPAQSLIEAGDVTPLVLLLEDRLDDYPDIPTTLEVGINLTNGVERGLGCRSDVPDEIVEILEKAMFEAMNTDRYREYEKSAYLHLRDGWLGADDYRSKLEKDIEDYRTILEKTQN